MGKTRQIPSADWQRYFDRFSRSFLRDDGFGATGVDVLSPTLGNQIESQTTRFLDISYDPDSNALEVRLEDVERLAFQPSEIWVIEEDGGFVSAMEIKGLDGSREILYLHRNAPLALRDQGEGWP